MTDAAAIRDRLGATLDMFGGCLWEPNDIIEIRACGPDRRVERKWRTAQGIPALAAWMQSLNDAGLNVYAGIHPRTITGGSTAVEVALARSLFVDADDTAPEELLRRIDEAALPAPSVVIHSGHGAHAYWRLKEPMHDLALWSRHQKALIAQLDTDPVIHDAPRIMRLPGLLNVKREPAVPCKIVRADLHARYELGEFPTPATESAPSAAPAVNGEIPQGKRNATLTSLDGSMQRRGFSRAARSAALHQTNIEKCKPPLPAEAVDKILDSIGRYLPAAPGLDTGEVIERADPIPLAEHFVDAHYRDDRGWPLLRRWRGDWWRWAGAAYENVSDEALDAQLYCHLEQLWTLGANDRVVKIRASDRLVREVRLAMPSRDLLLENLEAPAWLDETHDQDPRKMLPCRNGLLDLASLELLPASPGFFTINSLPFDYNPHAPEPKTWLRFLDDLWGDDLASIELLREWFAYILSPETRMQKILLICGPKRSGKGTIGRVLTALIGAANVAAPTMGSFATNFGLQALLHRRLAIISDARLSGRTDQAVVVERLLSISGEDPIGVDRKHRDPLHVRLPTRIMLLTNELPRLVDTSGAMASRFLVLTLTQTFFGREDHFLADAILAELPGVLNWSLIGWEQLQTRGRFVQPESSGQAIEAMEDLASPLGAFIRDRCVIDPAGQVEAGTLFAAWKSWGEDNGRDHPGTVQTFGRDLRAVLPGIRVRQPRTTGGGRDRVYQGVSLNGTA